MLYAHTVTASLDIRNGSVQTELLCWCARLDLLVYGFGRNGARVVWWLLELLTRAYVRLSSSQSKSQIIAFAFDDRSANAMSFTWLCAPKRRWIRWCLAAPVISNTNRIPINEEMNTLFELQHTIGSLAVQMCRQSSGNGQPRSTIWVCTYCVC